MSAIHNRFKDAPWYANGKEIMTLIGGAGGIGSWLVLLLARAGFISTVYDEDTIEIHNIGGQFFRANSIGKYKVDEVKELVQDLCSVSILPMVDRITAFTPSNKYCFSAFDNMLARKEMFTKWKEAFTVPLTGRYDPNAVFIDGRLEAEHMFIYVVRADDTSAIQRYQDLLVDDSEIPEAACTMKQTSHAAAMIASHMVGYFTNHITNVNQEEKIRNIPFCFEYSIPVDMVMQEN